MATALGILGEWALGIVVAALVLPVVAAAVVDRLRKHHETGPRPLLEPRMRGKPQ